MQMSNNIIWLSSYPKSGNTWFRSFLTALFNLEAGINLNELISDGNFPDKKIVEEVLDVDADLLQAHEIKKFQHISWTHISKTAKNRLFVKIHDAYENLHQTNNKPLIPYEATFKAVYFVRNPFDIVPSFSNHVNISLDHSVDYINHSHSTLHNSEKQFAQHVGTWNEHVKSWLTLPKFPVLFLRFEDMKLNTFETFQKAVKFLELDFTDQEIRKAIEMTSFEKLRKLEEKFGFIEIKHSNYFFNKGEINYGKQQLSNSQIESIKKVNKEMMKHFEYWH